MACTTLRVSLTQESMTTFTPGFSLAQLLQRLQAVDAGHEQVEQHQVGPQTLSPRAAALLRRWRRFHFVVVHFEQGADVPQHSRFVIDQQNVGRFAHLFFPLAGC